MGFLVSDQDLQKALPLSYLARGRNYYQQGRVLQLHAEDGLIVSTVQGSEYQPYRCTVTMGRSRQNQLLVDGECSCPIGYNCKHVAATLVAFSAQQQEARAGGITPQAQSWVQLITESALDSNSYPDELRDRLLYVLGLRNHPTTGIKQLTLNLQRARLLKDGSYGQARTYQPNPYNLAQFLRPIDLQLLQIIGWGEALATLDSQTLSPELWGHTLLPMLLETGRCHWLDKDSPPLQAAPARPGRFEWGAVAGARLQLQLLLDDEELTVLPLAPPWYLNPSTSEAGPVSTELPERLAAALAAAPSLSVPVAEQVSLKLAALPLPKALPLPTSLQRVERNDIRPQPQLLLNSAAQGDFAQLSFSYAGEEVAAANGPPVLTSRRDGQLLLIQRDQMQEAAAIEQLRQLGFSQHAESFELPDEQAWIGFMREGFPQLTAAGWQIEYGSDFRFHLASVDDWDIELVEEPGHSWFKLDLGVTVDGERVQLLPLLCDAIRRLPQMLEPAQLAIEAEEERELPLWLEDGRLLPLPMTRIRPILTTLLELYEPHPLADGSLQMNRLQSAQLAALEAQTPVRWAGGEALRELGSRLQNFQGIQPVAPPQGLQAELRPYQQEGLNWLQFLREFGFSGVLADDMGLGKTLQTLAHLLLEKESGRTERPSLVVCPTSLLPNWRREASRFAPELKVLTLHGADRQADFESMGDYDLILTTYALLSRDAEALTAQGYHLLVLDEAQYIKNPRTKAASTARALTARQRLALTGTPLENHLGELWSLFHFLMPGLLGTQERFNRLFRRPIERQSDPVRREQLQQRVAPFLLRRTKAEVATELPAKTEILQSVTLEGAQRDLYETVRVAMDQRVRAEVAAKGWARSQIVVLDALLKLRQICCDPRLVKLAGTRSVKRSAKLELLLEMLPSLISEGRRILLFSQFTSMLTLIEEAIAPLAIPYVKLTGSTRDRATPVERFQAGEVPLFLISLKAGGTGLNLTAADTIIHYDPWWNPAVERQATDRAHRIGQTQPVMVYKLIAEGTVEEKMAELQSRKQALTDAMLEAGQAAGTNLSAEDLQALFAPLA